jgi:hypothetical protein
MLQIQLHLRVTAAKVAQHGGELVKQRHRCREGDAQTPARPWAAMRTSSPACWCSSTICRALSCSSRPAGVSATARRERSNNCAPISCSSETDLLAQRGLAHMQALGRTAEIQLLGHSQKTGRDGANPWDDFRIKSRRKRYWTQRPQLFTIRSAAEAMTNRSCLR